MKFIIGQNRVDSIWSQVSEVPETLCSFQMFSKDLCVA